MPTQCNQESFEFHPLGRREVRGRFDGGAITSDAGGLLLREVEKRTGIIAQFAACFQDHRDPERIEHTVKELVAQRVYALALGYEDLNDHDQLAAGSVAGGVGGEARSDGREPGAGARPGQGLGGQEHAESVGADGGSGERGRTLQEDRAGGSGGGSPAGGSLPPGPSRTSARDRPGFGRDGRSGAWEPRGAILPRLLRALLLLCRCISFAGSICWARACGHRISMLRRAAGKNWSGSWRRFGRLGRK